MKIRELILFMESRGLIDTFIDKEYDAFLNCLRCRSYIVISSRGTRDKIYELYDNEEDAQERVDVLRMLNRETEVVRSSFKRTELPVSFDEFIDMIMNHPSLLKLRPAIDMEREDLYMYVETSGVFLSRSAWDVIDDGSTDFETVRMI